MAIRIKIYTAHLSRRVPFPRRCEFCGHAYEYSHLISKFAEGGTPGEANQDAQARFSKEAGKVATGRYERETFGVLCPACDCFSSASLRRYYPAGVREGLIRLYPYRAQSRCSGHGADGVHGVRMPYRPPSCGGGVLPGAGRPVGQ